jgi:hypothetical protein
MADDRKLRERFADWDTAFQVVFIVVMFVVGFVLFLLDR